MAFVPQGQADFVPEGQADFVPEGQADSSQARSAGSDAESSVPEGRSKSLSVPNPGLNPGLNGAKVKGRFGMFRCPQPGRARLRPSRGQRETHDSDGASPYQIPGRQIAANLLIFVPFGTGCKIVTPGNSRPCQLRAHDRDAGEEAPTWPASTASSPKHRLPAHPVAAACSRLPEQAPHSRP